MYTAVKGMYENGQVTISEPVPPIERSEVIVTFLGGEQNSSSARRPGFLKDWAEAQGITIVPLPDDFNEPLDDLADYM